jgi:Cohesin loading factor
MSNNQETLLAISQLKVIATLAGSHGDSAISAVASAIEALVHANRSNTSDSIEQAQRALAAARGSQLDAQAQSIHPLTVMAYFVDLCCSIHQNDPMQATSKLAAMNTFLDQRANDSGWSADGQFFVPLSHNTSQSLQVTEGSQGAVRSDHQGRLSIRIQWLPKAEIYSLGYILSAAAVVHKNAQDGQKAEAFLREAASKLALDNPDYSCLICH